MVFILHSGRQSYKVKSGNGGKKSKAEDFMSTMKRRVKDTQDALILMNPLNADGCRRSIGGSSAYGFARHSLLFPPLLMPSKSAKAKAKVKPVKAWAVVSPKGKIVGCGRIEINAWFDSNFSMTWMKKNGYRSVRVLITPLS